MKSDAAPELTISDVIMSKAVKPAEEITSFKFAIDVCCVGSVQI